MLFVPLFTLFINLFNFQAETACRVRPPLPARRKDLWHALEAGLSEPAMHGGQTHEPQHQDTPRQYRCNQIRQSCPGLAENVWRCMKNIKPFVMSFIQGISQHQLNMQKPYPTQTVIPTQALADRFTFALSVILVPLAPPASSACRSSSHPTIPLEAFNSEMATAWRQHSQQREDFGTKIDPRQF